MNMIKTEELKKKKASSPSKFPTHSFRYPVMTQTMVGGPPRGRSGDGRTQFYGNTVAECFRIPKEGCVDQVAGGNWDAVYQARARDGVHSVICKMR